MFSQSIEGMAYSDIKSLPLRSQDLYCSRYVTRIRVIITCAPSWSTIRLLWLDAGGPSVRLNPLWRHVYIDTLESCCTDHDGIRGQGWC